ncbi:MAG: hypothetical protein FWD53_08770 [Phycisphaerales bacterium]|nr:hypothetical protein [Phycisphaerales bacterium]
MKTVTSNKFKPRQPAPSLPKRTRFTGPSAHLIGSLKGKIHMTGDIISTGRKWHAQS